MHIREVNAVLEKKTHCINSIRLLIRESDTLNWIHCLFSSSSFFFWNGTKVYLNNLINKNSLNNHFSLVLIIPVNRFWGVFQTSSKHNEGNSHWSKRRWWLVRNPINEINQRQCGRKNLPLIQRCHLGNTQFNKKWNKVSRMPYESMKWQSERKWEKMIVKYSRNVYARRRMTVLFYYWFQAISLWKKGFLRRLVEDFVWIVKKHFVEIRRFSHVLLDSIGHLLKFSTCDDTLKLWNVVMNKTRNNTF